MRGGRGHNMAEAKAVARFVRVPAQKARLVVDLIRGKDVNSALVQVQVAKRQAARIVEKVLRSAMANATQNHGVRDVDRLMVAQAYVNEGPTMKRIQPRAMGRAFRIRKRSSHITIVLQERGQG
jgi:large subunit ribosomal protein L22